MLFPRGRPKQGAVPRLRLLSDAVGHVRLWMGEVKLVQAKSMGLFEVVNVERVANASERALFLILPLFVASGCAALIYEIVWFQLLELVIGSSTVSLGILLATYMGGLCLGSLWLPRLISARLSPLLVYGVLEFGIGLCAVALLFVLPSVGALYVAHAEHGLASIALRGALCAVLLLPPTILMGATLPAIARWVESSPQGISWLGKLYAGNIAGAVLGCLFAGFYLLRIYDMATATYAAATINAALAIAAYVLASESTRRKFMTAEPPATPAAPAPAASPSQPREVYFVIALSGLTALGSQVVWNRVLGLILGPSVYTFSIILAVFLIGLGIGSGVGSLLAGTSARPRLALGICQLLLVAGLAWAALMINGSLPYWPINRSLTLSPWYNFQLDLLRVMWAILPAASLWGASFPLALAAAASPGEDPGRLAGAVYAANTLGSIVGALAFSTLLIPALGTSDCERLLIGICLFSGLAMLVALMPDRKGKPVGQELPVSRGGMSLALAAVVVTSMLLWIVPGTPAALIALGRDLPQWNPMPQILFIGEGITSSVAVMDLSDGTRTFVVSGRPEASSNLHDMRTQRMIGHIAALLHQKPRSVLIVGFGAGVTAGSFVLYPDVERIVICEIEPLVPQVVSTFFTKENYDLLKDPRVEIVYDDARHYLLTTREHFDIITSDPIHPWVKGSAALYTQEYFELARSHLNPGGVVTQWVPFYESSLDVVKSELATFFRVFPRGLVFSNQSNKSEGGGWDTDTVLFGAADPKPIDPDRIQLMLYREDYRRVRQSLADVNFFFVTDLLSTYAGQASDLVDWLKDAQINTDRDLRLQYLAGLANTNMQGAEIYDDMLRQRRYPTGLFVGSEETDALLRQALASEGEGKLGTMK
jgi:spermidine synthase